MYLDISSNDMIENYEKYYEDYIEKKINLSKSCPYKCGKIFSHNSGLSRHKKTCKHKNQIEQDSIIINSFSTINVTDNDNAPSNILNITLQNYGEEVIPPNLQELYKILYDDIKKNMGKDIISKTIEFLHVATKENRNMLVRDNKSRTMEVFRNDKWIIIDKRQMKDIIVCNSQNSLLSLLTYLLEQCENEQDTKIVKKIIKYFRIDIDDLSTTQLFSRYMTILINNKDILLEYNKASKKANIIKSNCKTIAEYNKDYIKSIQQEKESTEKLTQEQTIESIEESTMESIDEDFVEETMEEITNKNNGEPIITKHDKDIIIERIENRE